MGPQTTSTWCSPGNCASRSRKCWTVMSISLRRGAGCACPGGWLVPCVRFDLLLGLLIHPRAVGGHECPGVLLVRTKFLVGGFPCLVPHQLHAGRRNV